MGQFSNIVIRLWAGQPRYDSRQGEQHFPIRHRVWTSCGAHIPSCPMRTGGEVAWYLVKPSGPHIQIISTPGYNRVYPKVSGLSR
jgi:hypothetical protein